MRTPMDECAVDHVDAAVLADADVVDEQAEQGVVDDRDLGLAVGLQAPRIHGRLDRPGGIGAAVSVNPIFSSCWSMRSSSAW